jgi:hypothetical protein
VRRLITLLIVLAVIAVGLDVLDNLAKDRAESTIASRIEASSPGSHATVRITSFPFLGRLAVSGHVPKMQADVTDVKSGDITFASIRLTIDNLRVDRNDLFSGKVKPLSIARGRVFADVSQASVDSIVHLPLVLQAGHVSSEGVSVPVHLTVSGGSIGFAASGLPSLSIKIPVLDVLPCVGAAQVVKGAVHVSCRFRKLPPLLSDTTFGA